MKGSKIEIVLGIKRDFGSNAELFNFYVLVHKTIGTARDIEEKIFQEIKSRGLLDENGQPSRELVREASDRIAKRDE